MSQGTICGMSVPDEEREVQSPRGRFEEKQRPVDRGKVGEVVRNKVRDNGSQVMQCLVGVIQT